jgi:hypothetical protein
LGHLRTTPPYNKGRTATHEIGHWLNLFHLWGNPPAFQDNGNCQFDDFVGDTPQQKFHSTTDLNNGCPTFPDISRRCNTADVSTMFMNYMDFVNDDCYNLFSNGQRNRSRALFAIVNGVNGPRVNQLNNWFKVRQKVNPIRCNDIIYSGPLCLPTIWTILSGPATILSGQGTNQAFIRATGVGTVLVRAVSGNYISEENITVSNLLPSISGGTYSTNGQNLPLLVWNGGNNDYNIVCNLQLTNTNMNIQGATTVTWSRISNIPNYPAPWSQNGNDLSFYLTSVNQKTIFRVTASNNCGSVFLDFGFKSTECSNPCNSFNISPNPAMGSLRVIVPNVPPPCLSASAGTVKGKSYQEQSISEIRIYDNSGNLKRIQKEYKTKQSTVNISGFKPGVYIVEVSDGAYKERHRVLVKE